VSTTSTSSPTYALAELALVGARKALTDAAEMRVGLRCSRRRSDLNLELRLGILGCLAACAAVPFGCDGRKTRKQRQLTKPRGAVSSDARRLPLSSYLEPWVPNV
jgi:hypothetical protein